MTTSLITTAIPYVNARPHLGFAYEVVLGDILARHRRSRGRRVRFTTGTDEHSLKNVDAAAREGVPVGELVDRNAEAFRALGPLLDLSPDEFIRTSVDRRHRPIVEWLWRACAADLDQRAWHGRYCPGCEAFVDDDVELCAEHGVAPEPVAETNWFFALSRYRDRVRAEIESGRLEIVPEGARAETLAFLSGEVRDLSVSRDAARAAGWGILVPDDPSQVIYVWFDALASYVATEGLDGWRAAGERVHVIGKGVTRFHAVYWPAFLLAAGLPLPHTIAVHGYLTVDGAKIRKSGRGLDVAPFVERAGATAVRWYFARRCRTRVDSDVSLAAVEDAHDRDLADGLGNLVQRTTALVAKLGAPCDPGSSSLRSLADGLPARVDAALAAFAIDEAAAAIVALVDAANRSLAETQPWRTRRADDLWAPLHAARVAAEELAPIAPAASRAVLARLASGQAGPPLFPRLSGLRRPGGEHAGEPLGVRDAAGVEPGVDLGDRGGVGT